MSFNEKKLIINADDFGLNTELNDAVFDGFKNGILTQTSLVANGDAFDDAINRVVPNCNGLAVGVHLNTYEGKALTDCPMLTNKNGFFNKSFIQTMINSNNKDFLAQIEKEWEAQILKIINGGIVPSHIDSHVHYHAIPNLFKIAVKLAKKYNIKNIRTQYENFYINKINSVFIINIIKNLLLKFFTNINRRNFELNSNDFLIGILYTSMMDSKKLISGLRKLPKSFFAETLIHPKKNDEFALLFDKELNNYLKRENIILTNYNGEFFEI